MTCCTCFPICFAVLVTWLLFLLLVVMVAKIQCQMKKREEHCKEVSELMEKKQAVAEAVLTEAKAAVRAIERLCELKENENRTRER